MKTCLLFIFLSSLCFAAQDSAIVRFTNGDKLSGNAIALDLETLTWESELLKDQTQFKLNQILDLQLPSKLDHQSTEQAAHEAVLELTNGDLVKGLLIGLNKNEIRLKTWYAGEMVFPRLNVKSININRNSKVLYRGPIGMEGWTTTGNEGTWTFLNNELISKNTGSIGREIDFTDEVKINYDIKWKGMMRSKVIFFSSDVKSATPNTGYEIYFQGSMIQIRRLTDNLRLGSKMSSIRAQVNEKSNIEIRVSRKTKKILVFIDDALQGIWDDDALDKMDGNGMLFNSDYNNGIAISNILVSEWDGFIDETLIEDVQFQDPRFGMRQLHRGGRVPIPQESKELPEGRMMLSNGDTIEGEVLGIEGEMIKIKTPFTEVTFPVHRINNIALKKASLETPKLLPKDVRAYLADGSRMVFEIREVKDGKFTGYSQNFGFAEFNQSAFERIEFNIHWRDK